MLQKAQELNQSTKGHERGTEKYRGGWERSWIQMRKYLYNERTQKKKKLHDKNIKGYGVIENFIILAKC